MKPICALAALSLLLGCNRFAKEDKKAGQAVRLVVIAKQYTELIYALGAQQDIAAVDISSDYPPAAKQLPTVGYHRALSLEGILAAKPSLILCDGLKSLGPEHVVQQLQELKIPMKMFGKGEDVEGAKALMREMGAYFHKESRADSLCAKLDADMAAALEAAKAYTDKPKVLVIHFGQASNVWLLMARRNSVAGRMIAWAGGELAIDDTSGMRQMSAEVVSQSDPDVILLTDFGYDRLGDAAKIKELPGVALTKAAARNRIYRIDAHELIYLGPRTGENTLKLQKLIHGNGPAS